MLEGGDAQWGIGEHSDYEPLTILLQDDVGGLMVKTPGGWIAAPPNSGSFVCTIGDTLDRMTVGLYRSMPHRTAPHRTAIDRSKRDRLSFSLFFDPNFFNRVQRTEVLADTPAVDNSAERSDRINVHAFHGRYGDSVLATVGKVFPELRTQVLWTPHAAPYSFFQYRQLKRFVVAQWVAAYRPVLLHL